MPRTARIDFPGALHHVMFRGVERRLIFFDDHDKNHLLTRLGVTWIAIGGNAAATSPTDGAEVVLFFGNDADGALAVAMTTIASDPNITGFWKATWQAPPVTLQFDTTTNFVAAFLIDGRQLAEVCMLPDGATNYTCAETHL